MDIMYSFSDSDQTVIASSSSLAYNYLLKVGDGPRPQFTHGQCVQRLTYLKMNAPPPNLTIIEKNVFITLDGDLSTIGFAHGQRRTTSVSPLGQEIRLRAAQHGVFQKSAYVISPFEKNGNVSSQKSYHICAYCRDEGVHFQLF